MSQRFAPTYGIRTSENFLIPKKGLPQRANLIKKKVINDVEEFRTIIIVKCLTEKTIHHNSRDQDQGVFMKTALENARKNQYFYKMKESV